MSRPRGLAGAVLAAAMVLGIIGTTAGKSGGTGLSSTRVLRARLAPAGRATAAVQVTLPDPMGGPGRVERGSLALEPPDRLRLDFPASGERIAVRGDGGEWLQPATRQLVRIRPEQVALASWLWDVFLRGGADRFSELMVAGTFVLKPGKEAREGLPDLVVTLDARGLPASLKVMEPSAATYEFRSWRFSRPRGARAFTLSAPAGYAIVDLP